MNVQPAHISFLKTHQELIFQRWADSILKAPWAEGISRDWLIKERFDFLFPLLIELIEKPDNPQLESKIHDIIRHRISAETSLRELSIFIDRLWHVTNEIISLNFQDPKELCKILDIWADVILVFITTVAEAYLKLTKSELDSYIKRIEKLVVLDELTGLFNRRKFDEALNIEVERAIRYKRHLSLLMLDIDHFKNYNDRNGHLKGDKLLKEIAYLIMIQLRSSDYGFRYGGEEFAILLPETGKEGGLEVAERIRKSVEESGFERSEDQPLGKVSVSIGVAGCPEDAINSRALINMADMALYEAKNSGRNRICLV